MLGVIYFALCGWLDPVLAATLNCTAKHGLPMQIAKCFANMFLLCLCICFMFIIIYFFGVWLAQALPGSGVELLLIVDDVCVCVCVRVCADPGQLYEAAWPEVLLLMRLRIDMSWMC